MEKVKKEIDLSLRLAIIVCINVFLVIFGTFMLLNKYKNRNIKSYIACKNINQNEESEDFNLNENSVIFCNIYIPKEIKLKTTSSQYGETITLLFNNNLKMSLSVSNIEIIDKKQVIIGYILDQDNVQNKETIKLITAETMETEIIQ